jgi:hypothetical protein
VSLNECNLNCGIDLEALRDFTRVSSDYYPDLAWHSPFSKKKQQKYGRGENKGTIRALDDVSLLENRHPVAKK